MLKSQATLASRSDPVIQSPDTKDISTDDETKHPKNEGKSIYINELNKYDNFIWATTPGKASETRPKLAERCGVSVLPASLCKTWPCFQ